jgi:hypothetical protein
MNIKKKFSNIKSGASVQSDAQKVALKKIEVIIKKREEISSAEFDRGYNLIKKYPLSVSILGSARFKEDSIYYQKARTIANKIVKELGYAVVTGGGPGIMEAANRGAFEAGGASLGFVINLPREQVINKYMTEYVEFEYFSSRKTLLFFSAEAYIYMPGGFGTLDELFEVLTLIQTNKMPGTPVILVGKEFWTPFLNLFREKLDIETHTISPEDNNLYKIVDSDEEIIDIIRKAPFREEKV